MDKLSLGKGCYIWKPSSLNTDIVKMMVDARVDHVCFKAVDGSLVYPIDDYIPLMIEKGIKVGIFGYIYLRYNPVSEAKAMVSAINRYNPTYALLDFESQSDFQFASALLYTNYLAKNKPESVLIGSNTWWKPSYHPNTPIRIMRGVCDFDCPQIYCRGSGISKKYYDSKAEYSVMRPRLPWILPAGDMYYEYGIKPTPQQVLQFMKICRTDPETSGCLMWSADQYRIVPELWSAFGSYDWRTDQVIGYDPPTVPVPILPLYFAVVTPSAGLNVRSAPKIASGNILYALPRGERITVYSEIGGWGRIDPTLSKWVYLRYIKKL